jgi:NAD+ synthase
LSGGVDSAVVAKLCVRAIGPEKVLALYIAHKYGAAKHREDAKRIANLLGIKLEVIDLEPLLEGLGVYNRFPMNFLEWLPGRVKGWVAKKGKELIEKITGKDLIIESRKGSTIKFVSGGSAYVNLIRRLQMSILHYYADLKNLLVVGAANRTEWLTGVFVKFGADGVADIMPILPLYKTQVKQLARYLQLPEDIVEKPADPDVFPGFSDKEKIIGKEETLDRILFALEKGLPPCEIAIALNVDLKEIEKIQALIEASKHMREAPYIPDLVL